MSKEMITRAEFKGQEVAPAWMLVSGVGDEWESRIYLRVPMHDGKVAQVPMDVHDAGELHQALEAHMENVAAGDVQPITPEERDRLLRKDRVRGNLRAVRDELEGKGPEETFRKVDLPRTDPGVDPEFTEAMEEVLGAWILAGAARARIRKDSPTLARALDRLAELNA